MKKYTFIALFLCCISSSWANDSLSLENAHPNRMYYQPFEKYTLGTFFSQIDIPTNFGVGFIPDKESAEQFAYYSAMFLEWRRYMSFGWFIQAGLDSHDHNYKGQTFAGSPQFNSSQWYNTAKGTVFNMQLMVGGGYKIPIIPIDEFAEFYEHPWFNRWNIGFLAQIGCSWSRTKFVEASEIQSPDPNRPYYNLEDQHHVYPVVKVGTMVECFTNNHFAIFVAVNYMQHLMRQPWDSPKMTGTLSFGIGFAGFYHGNLKK